MGVRAAASALAGVVAAAAFSRDRTRFARSLLRASCRCSTGSALERRRGSPKQLGAEAARAAVLGAGDYGARQPAMARTAAGPGAGLSRSDAGHRYFAIDGDSRFQ